MMTVTVKKIGGSVAVLIPKAMAQELSLTEGTPLDLTTNGQTIVMQRRGRRPRRSMKSIAAQIKRSSYRRRRLELGEDSPVGKELW